MTQGLIYKPVARLCDYAFFFFFFFTRGIGRDLLCGFPYFFFSLVTYFLSHVLSGVVADLGLWPKLSSWKSRDNFCS